MPIAYGLQWDESWTPLKIEMKMVRNGGYLVVGGQRVGEGLSHHYEAVRKMLWPRLDDHRWHRLCRDEILKNKVTVLMGCGSSGKAQPLDATVFTPSGPVQMASLKIGDRVCTPSGHTAIIREIFPQGMQEVWMVIFTDGACVEATPDHLWEVSHNGRTQVLTTEQLRCELSLNPKHPPSIHPTKPVYFQAKKFMLHPYLLGVLLGDGGLSNANVCFSTKDSEILERVKGCLPDGLCVKRSFRQCDYRIVKNGGIRTEGNSVLDALRFYRLWGLRSHEKYIPEVYLYGARAQRRELVRGLLDTDGFVGKNGEINFSTTSLALAKGFRFLIQSLGGQVRIRSRIPHYRYKGILKAGKRCFTCSVNIKESRRLFYLDRKRNRIRQRIHKRNNRVIQSIVFSGYKECQCLRIDSPERLYVTDHCIPTHNTHEASWIYLVDYLCSPDDTCVLVSSTDLRGLRLRVWGEITMLWQEAIERFPDLPGHLLESRIAITTDEMLDSDYSDRQVRDMRKGIVGVPCIQGGKFVGLGKFVGVKQKRVRLIADECQFMGASFLSAFSNLNKNEDFRAICIGNPNDPLDPLGKAAEPLDGWSGHLQPAKTEVWKTRFMNGSCVNLIGTDSPNFDFPENQPTRYKYLISREKIADTLSFFPKDSFEYYSQCVGCMKVGTLDDRIITRDLCRNFGALEDVIWQGTETIKICALDAAYGGDRAVCGHIEFGECVGGHKVLAFNPPQIVPINVSSTTSPEDQLAVWIKDYCERNDIPPSNFFHDSTGRGGLGTAIARVWSAECNPVEFGGAATDRPVAMGLYTFDIDSQTRRLIKCSEYYDRMVSELWYQLRFAIESRQIRRLPEDVMDELCMRKWERKKNNRVSIETKEKMKERIGRSPDLGDWATLCLEGARRLGFVIEKMPNDPNVPNADQDYLQKEVARYKQLTNKRQLHYT